MIARRNLLVATAALFIAPAIVRASSLMPIKVLPLDAFDSLTDALFVPRAPITFQSDDLYKLVDKVPVPALGFDDWAIALGQEDRCVAQTTLPNDVRVSTVFLGIDHSFSALVSGNDPVAPVLFETMIFGGEHDQYQERCCTWAEAEAMHARAVARLTTTPITQGLSPLLPTNQRSIA